MNKLHTKSSIVLFEFLISMLIFSIIIIYTFNISLNLYDKKYIEHQQLISLLKLESTKLFIKKNISNISNIKFLDNKLYYKDYLLLNNLNSFNLSSSANNIYTIQIKTNNIEQKWKIKNEL